MSAKPHAPATLSPRPKGRPKGADLVELEERLIRVAREAFFRDGYGPTTMHALAAAARVSKNTLYARFPSKGLLFRAIVQAQMNSWETGANYEPLGALSSLKIALRAYGDVWLRVGMSADYGDLSRLVFAESRRFPELADASRLNFARGIASLATVIREFAAIDEVPCRNPEGAAEVFQLAIGGWVYNAILSNKTCTLTEARAWLDYFIEIFMAGRSAW